MLSNRLKALKKDEFRTSGGFIAYFLELIIYYHIDEFCLKRVPPLGVRGLCTPPL